MRRNRLLTARIAITFVFVSLALLPVFSQGQNKTIEWPKKSLYNTRPKAAPDAHITDRIDDVEIEGIVVESRLVKIGEPFVASDDWIKNIGFRVKNISGKQLTAVQISLVLPEMSEGSPQVPFCYGCASIEKQKGIVPGEEVELTMPAGGLYPWLKSRITEKGGLSRISKAQIHIVFVTLLDGTVWSSGCVKTADPKNACPRSSP